METWGSRAPQNESSELLIQDEADKFYGATSGAIMVGANAPTPPYGGGLTPPTPPIMVGASAPTPP